MHKVLVIDFGSQYCKLIARRIREMGILSEILPANKSNIVDRAKKYDAIIMSGGPNSIYDKNSLTIDKNIFKLNIPILGTCYGMQIIHHLLGGKIKKLDTSEFGKVNLYLEKDTDIVSNVEKKSIVWMSHYDSIVKMAPGFESVAKTDICIAMTQNVENKIYTTQFHPEVTNTIFGKKIISNFIFKIAKLKPEWCMPKFLKTKIAEVKKIVGNNQVILGLSGGVDSSVVAALLYKAIGEQLIPIFIDNGLLRKKEVEKVQLVFKKYLSMKVIVLAAQDVFYDALKGIEDPEAKRKVIGKVFVDEFTKVKNKYKNVKFLAQGTIYPDVIESSGEHGIAHVIKSHHNVGSLPKNLDFKILEPIRELFKDEVRKLGKELNLPSELIMRHPFPGPGLAIRIIGGVTKKRVRILQEADDIFISNLIKKNLYHEISQAATILTPLKTVGVQGDKRTYKNLLVLRAVNTTDFMTASFSRIDFEFLDDVATEIINKVNDINRVVYDITSKPPGTIEWE